MKTNKIITIACILITIISFALTATGFNGAHNYISIIGAAAILPPLLIHAHKRSGSMESMEFVPFWLVSQR